MPLTPEIVDITGYPLIPLKKTADGQYIFPRDRYGILPYFINPAGHIVWGCVESNRFEPLTIAPAAGTQDIIAIKGGQRLALELGKPVPHLDPEFKFLHSFIGTSFREAAYQDIIECLITNGFQVYLENPLATAIHEALEEHGIDLRPSVGHDTHILKISLESSEYQVLPAQHRVAALGAWLPELTGFKDVKLRHTDKIDTKVYRNRGREFYEKGVWVTLEEFKQRYLQEKDKFASLLNGYLPEKAELITETFRAFDRNLQFLEQIEPSLLTSRHEKQLNLLDISIQELPKCAPTSIKPLVVSNCSSTFFNATSADLHIPSVLGVTEQGSTTNGPV